MLIRKEKVFLLHMCDPLKKEQGELSFCISFSLWVPLPDCGTLRDYTQKISGVREGE